MENILFFFIRPYLLGCEPCCVGVLVGGLWQGGAGHKGLSLPLDILELGLTLPGLEQLLGRIPLLLLDLLEIQYLTRLENDVCRLCTNLRSKQYRMMHTYLEKKALPIVLF